MATLAVILSHQAPSHYASTVFDASSCCGSGDNAIIRNLKQATRRLIHASLCVTLAAAAYSTAMSVADCDVAPLHARIWTLDPPTNCKASQFDGLLVGSDNQFWTSTVGLLPGHHTCTCDMPRENQVTSGKSPAASCLYDATNLQKTHQT